MAWADEPEVPGWGPPDDAIPLKPLAHRWGLPDVPLMVVVPEEVRGPYCTILTWRCSGCDTVWRGRPWCFVCYMEAAGYVPAVGW